MAEPPHIRVKKWLEDVIENSEKAVDSGWSVESDDEDPTLMLIDSDQTPFKITVVAGEEITYIAFVTNLQLAGLEPGLLAPALRDLMIKNKEVDFVKFCLMEPDDTVMLRTDLYSKYMSKNEFNTALEHLILLGRWLIVELEKGQDLDGKMDELDKLAAAALLKGESPEEVRANLIKVGVEEARATEIVTRLVELLSIDEDEEEEEEMVVIAEVPRSKKTPKDSAVDRYIW